MILHRSISVIDKFQAGSQVLTTVAMRVTKDTYKIRSNYVLGCDGAKSQVRKWLGVESEGEDSCKIPSNRSLISV